MFRHLLLLSILIALSSQQTTDDIYVTPTKSCGSTCIGNITQPYDNLLYALQAADSQATKNIILLNNNSLPHYVLKSESNDTSGPNYTISTTVPTYTLRNVVISPLFCDDTTRSNLTNFTSYCVNRTQRLTVYMKTSFINLIIQGNVTVNNIIFNGIEAIQDYRTDQVDNYTTCLSSRRRCCVTKSLSSSSNFDANLKCIPGESPSSVDVQTDSFFILDSTKTFSDDNKRSLILANISLQNFWGWRMNSFIRTGTNIFELNLTNSTMDDVYFRRGLVQHINSSSDATTVVSTVNFDNVTLTNYNTWNQVWSTTATAAREGYLFYTENTFRGTFRVSKSNFTAINAATKDKCSSVIDSTAYLLNNQFTTKPGSRSDLWTLYNKFATNLNFASSLVYIHKMWGGITVASSTFQNVIGTVGSVFRVDDYDPNGSTKTFTLSDSTFDSNFAMDGFANIVVAKQSFLSSMQSIDDCPTVQISNTKFLKATGCPGSYGNVALICYWANQPSSKPALSNYNYFANFTPSKIATSDSPLITITTSTFQDNLLAVSNSFAVIGGYNTFMQTNTFQNNGGPIAQMIQTLNGTYFISKKPNQNFTDLYSYAHFSQSTAAYFDRIIKLAITGDTYKGNWGPWEGSQSLASCLTIKNWLNFANTIVIQGTTFRDHSGIPPIMKTNLTDTGLTNNVVTAPLVTVSYDEQGVKTVTTMAASGTFTSTAAHISLSTVTFTNNTASFDYSKYTYNSAETIGLTSAMSNMTRYKVGLIKFLSQAEVIDLIPYNYLTTHSTYNKLAISFSSSEISSNTLSTAGCLFATHLAETFLMRGMTIKTNTINSVNQTFIQSSTGSRPYIDQVLTNRDGIFCASAKESFDSLKTTSIVAASMNANNNTGILFNLYPDSTSHLYLVNSLIINNKCGFFSIIAALRSNNVTLMNNIFNLNNNALGTTFLHRNSQLMSVNATYLNNTGIHASVLYNGGDSNTQSFSISTKAYWNIVSPTNKFFVDKATPQGALYFTTSAQLLLATSRFRQNNAYAGLVISFTSVVNFTSSNITNHTISGIGLVGNFYESSTLTMTQTRVMNNSVAKDSTLPVTQPVIVSLSNSVFNANTLEISEVATGNEAILLSAIQTTGTLKSLKISSLLLTSGNPLISLYSSDITISGLTADNITCLFNAANTKLTVNSAAITNLKLDQNNSQYLSRTFNSTIRFNTFTYTGGLDAISQLSLISGENNYMEVVDATFTNAVNAQSTIFDMKDSKFFFIAKSRFSYTASNRNVLAFNLDSPQRAVISQCNFFSVGQVLVLDNPKYEFCFLSNNIVTDSNLQNIKFTNGNTTYFHNNRFIRKTNNTLTTIPDSQVFIQNTLSSVTMSNNTFMNLVGSNGILQIQSTTTPYTVTSVKDIYINNTASQGGALNLYASTPTTLAAPNITMQNAVFIRNKAITSSGKIGQGGAIYQTAITTNLKQVTTISESFFVNNTAASYGGAIYFDYMPPNINIMSKFVGNMATRLNHVGSYPAKLGYSSNGTSAFGTVYVPGQQRFAQVSSGITSTSNETDTWNDFVSGQSDNRTYDFAVLDMFGQVVYTDNSSILQIYPVGLTDAERSKFADVSVKAENGIYNLENLKLTYKVSDGIDMVVKSSAINPNKTIPLTTPITTNDSLLIGVNFRRCSRGEEIQNDGSFTICSECAPGFWQPDTIGGFNACQLCDDDTMYCFGGDTYGPKQGYSRLNESAYMIVKCPLEKACLGNDLNEYVIDQKLYSLGHCEVGYEGNLCNNCQYHWANTLNGPCEHCALDFGYYLKLVLNIIFDLILVFIVISGVVKLAEDYQADHETRNNAILGRILINYLQLIFLIGTIPAPWPRALRNVLYANSVVSSINELVVQLNCLYNSDTDRELRTVFLRLLLSNLIIPLLLTILCIIAWVIYFKIKREPIVRSGIFINRVIATLTIVHFSMMPTALKQAFSLFPCQNLYREDDPVYFLRADFDVQCWVSPHGGWAFAFALPALIVWIFVLPGIMCYLLIRYKNKLKDDEVAPRYSFLYGGYTSDKYHWEFMITIRKIILIIIIFAASFRSVDLQIYLSGVVIIVAYIFHLRNYPYADPALNRLEHVSLFSAIIFLLCGLYFQLVETSGGLDTLIEIIGIVFNLLFFLYFIKIYFRELLNKAAETKPAIEVRKRLEYVAQSEVWQKTKAGAKFVFGDCFKKTNKTQEAKQSENPLSMDKKELKRFARILYSKPSSFVVGSDFDDELENMVKQAKKKPNDGANTSVQGLMSNDATPKVVSNASWEREEKAKKRGRGSVLNIQDIMPVAPRELDNEDETVSERDDRRVRKKSSDNLFPLDISKVIGSPNELTSPEQ